MTAFSLVFQQLVHNILAEFTNKMPVTFDILKKALIRHYKLCVSLLAFNILLALTDLAGLLSISGAVQMLSHPQASFHWKVLEQLNIPRPNISIYTFLVLVVTFQILVSLCQYKHADLMSTLRLQLISWWSRDLIRTFSRCSWRVGSQYKATQLTHLMSFDFERMGEIFFLFLRMVSNLLLFTGYVVALFIFFDSKLLLLLAFLLLSLILIKKFLPNPRVSGELLGEASETLDRSLAHVFQGYKSLILRGQRQWRQVEENIHHQEIAYRSAYLVMLRGRAIQHILSLIFVGLGIALCLKFSSTGLEQLVLLAYLYYRLNPMVQQFLRDSQEWQQGEPSFLKAAEILAHLKSEPIQEGSQNLCEPIVELKVEGLSFTHLQAPLACFENLSFHAKQGQVILFKGRNGRGKSTLADVICRLLQAQSGHITANGTAIEQYTLTSWGQQVTYLPQDSFLVRGSIFKNCFWDENLGAAHWDLLKQHPLAHWLPQSREALESELNENDARLSGGTHRKICVLRALLAQASLVILDEPTEHLDAQCRLDFIRIIQQEKSSAIWLIFSHDPVCLEIADSVVDLDSTG